MVGAIIAFTVVGGTNGGVIDSDIKVLGRSFDVDDSTVLQKPITYGRDKLIWLKANTDQSG